LLTFFIRNLLFKVQNEHKRQTVYVWLIYRCKKSKHSWNLTVYERTKPGKILQDLFEAFESNDTEIAYEYGKNIDFFKKNNAELK